MIYHTGHIRVIYDISHRSYTGNIWYIIHVKSFFTLWCTSTGQYHTEIYSIHSPTVAKNKNELTSELAFTCEQLRNRLKEFLHLVRSQLYVNGYRIELIFIGGWWSFDNRLWFVPTPPDSKNLGYDEKIFRKELWRSAVSELFDQLGREVEPTKQS